MNELFKLYRHKGLISLILILSITFGCYQAYAEDLTSVKICIDDNWSLVKTDEENVQDFLNSQGIILNEKDIINVSLDTEITDNIRIIIQKAVTVNFNFTSGETISLTTSAGTIGTAINELSKQTGKNYKLADGQSSSTKLQDDMDIDLLVYEEAFTTIQEEISYSTQTIENDKLLVGTQNVKTSGVNGVKEIVTKDLYLEGELVSSETVSETILSEPINEVIEIGTKEQSSNTISTEKGTFVVEKEFTMKSSAYTSSVECTGKTPADSGYGVTASGMKAQYGVVAVDPNVIPLGTKLYIEGYGYAVAGDTGGAIKGNKIDLYFNTYSEAINYGVRQVKVYVLGEQI